MFDRLAEAIEEVSVAPDGPAIAAAVALRDRLEAKITQALVDFDAESLWDLDGATSATAWLRAHAGMTRREAARRTGLAKRARHLGAVMQAWSRGQLSSGQVDAVVACLDDATVGLFAEHQGELVPALVGLSVDDTARAMSAWKAHALALADDHEPLERARSLHLSSTLGGTWVLDGSLDPESGEVVATAVRLATTSDVPAEPARTPAERRADALVDVCRFFLDHQHHRAGGRHRPHLNVVVDLEDLAASRGGRMVDGVFLDGRRIAALSCDSAVHRVVVAGRSTILDYGVATRTIPAPLWNALVVRDEHCRFAGCDRKASWCEGHHVVHFSDGGPTCASNLVLLCSRHHHRLHQPGWHAKLRPDATLEITDPQGRHHVTVPPRALPRLC